MKLRSALISSKASDEQDKERSAGRLYGTVHTRYNASEVVRLILFQRIFCTWRWLLADNKPFHTGTAKHMTGILLAAGFSRRFSATDKLLQPLPDGRPVGLAAAQHLLQALPASIAIVRPDAHVLAELLEQAGLKVVRCGEHQLQMADSLAAAVRYASTSEEATDGYVIALADMPFIRPATIRAVADSLAAGASIIVPTYLGQRGHPVAFAPRFRAALLRLQGDEGARSILRAHPQEIEMLACDDPGILRDIDTPDELAGS